MGLPTALRHRISPEAADESKLDYGWHEYAVGLHAAPYINRGLFDHAPRPMRFFGASIHCR